MRLGELLHQTPPAATDVEITALAYDDRRVAPGTAFFCVRGFSRDGHEFASEAVARGAAALIVDHPLQSGIPEVIVDDVRAAMAPAAARLAGDPTTRLATIGVTGTNGKTTTAFLIRQLLEAAGRSTGILGTVTQVVGGQERDAGRTTPEAIDLQPLFAQMLAGGDSACVMEVSSHALALGRADAIHWAAAVFTNLTQDHLDFHADMEDYFAAKARLLAAADEVPKVIDVDDPYGRRLAAMHPDAITVGLDATDARVRAIDVETSLRGSAFTVNGRRLQTPMVGRFNVRNALQAYAVTVALGVPEATAAAALKQAGGVPGRLEPVDAGQPFAVLVDYAHTPDALENLLRTAREVLRGSTGRAICVFGCGGDRDRAKRPLMGQVVGAGADVAIVTSDNPRGEVPTEIVDAVLAGMEHASATVERIEDRRAAIARALELAEEEDLVLIAGKGHEQGQQFDDRLVPFDDRTVARELLIAAGSDRREDAHA